MRQRRKEIESRRKRLLKTMPSAGTVSPEDENLWAKILVEVQSRSAATLPQASLLVLGDNDSGKTSLIARLQRNEDPKKGAGLEYHYLEVNPDYTDGSYAYQLGSALPDVGPGESARLGVWVLDGDPTYAPLMRFALTPDVFERSVVLLCASMAEPWSILDSLERWAKILESHVSSGSPNYDKNVIRENREKQERFWQEYVEPLDSSSHSETGAKVPSMETDHILLPLGDNTLVHNTGLPIVVIITKCDAMSTLEKEYDFKEEQFDFIQQHIRKFCLNYGAALVYTSVKEGRNCDTLYKYLLHRVYEFPFTHPALVVEKDSIFIPAGWDNDKKIGILYENLSSFKPDDPFTDHIKKPTLRRPVPKDSELQAEDDQEFLGRLQSVWANQAPPSQSQKAPSQESPSLPRTKGLTSSQSIATSAPASKKLPSTEKLTTTVPTGQSSEGVLAQFFNNLLKTKGGPNGDGSQLNASKSFDASKTGDAGTEDRLNKMLSESKSRDSSQLPSADNSLAEGKDVSESAPE